MPSFREGEAECEKTLSVIYDDGDLARDDDQSGFNIKSRYVTAEPDEYRP